MPIRRLLSLATPALLLLPAAWPARPASPGVRNGHAMTYDSCRRRVILFGGADAGAVRGDTWEFDGARWARVATGGPAPRTFPALAFDRARCRAVLLGGNRVLFGSAADSLSFLDDTWEWDGSSWHRIEAFGPLARAEAVMVYDSVRTEVILFGGYRNAPGLRTRYGDTWAWDGHRWIRRSITGPAARNGAAMAWSGELGGLLLFGGSTGVGSGETWVWDGRMWRRQETVVGARFNPVMSAAPGGVVLRFGGWTGSDRTGDTWVFSSGRWTLLCAAGPAPRNHASLVFDEARHQVLLYGGHDGERVFGDAWTWDGAQWRQVLATAPEDRVPNDH